jgi:DNA polymerase III alpha subunit
MGIRLKGPDINESAYLFTIDDSGAIRYGLGAIRNLCQAAYLIALDRSTNGCYTSIPELFQRLDRKVVSKKSVDVLVLSGALDSLAETMPTEHRLGDGTIVDLSANLVSADRKVDRVKLLERLYIYRNLGDAEAGLQSFLDDAEGAAELKKQINRISDESLLEMQCAMLEDYLLGLIVSSHPLEGKAIPIDWELPSFETVVLIKDIVKTKTKRDTDMWIVTTDSLEGPHKIFVFDHFDDYVKKLVVGGIRIVNLTSRTDMRGISWTLRNIRYYRDT